MLLKGYPMTDCDLDFTTSGPGPVYVRGNSPEGVAFIGEAAKWCDGQGTAKQMCIDAMLSGLSCAVDNHRVTFQPA